MHYAQVLFSPTGGTRRAAEMIAGTWEPEGDVFDLTDPSVSPPAFRQPGGAYSHRVSFPWGRKYRGSSGPGAGGRTSMMSSFSFIR